MNGFRDHDELYWNAIGEYWEVPVETATATVSAPAAITDITCYAGPVSSTAPCDKERILEDGTARFRQSNLFPFEAFTVVVALPKGVVAEPQPQPGGAVEHRPCVLADAPPRWVCPAACSLLLIAGCGWLFWTRGRDRRFVGSPVDQTMGNADRRRAGGAAVRARRSPRSSSRRRRTSARARSARSSTSRRTPSTSPRRSWTWPSAGTSRSRRSRRKGWFGKPDWTLHRTDKADADLLTYEADAPDRAVQGRQRSRRSPACERTFSERLTKVEDQLYADAVKRGWFVKRPDKVRASWHARGALLFVAGLVLTFVLARWTTFGLVGIPVDRRGHHPHGRRSMDAQPDGEGHRDRPSRRRVPHRDRDRGDPHVAVGGGAERLHPVPAVRDRVRPARRSGRRRSRDWHRCRPTRRGTCRAGRSSTRTSAGRSTTSRSRPEARSRRRRRPPARAASRVAASPGGGGGGGGGGSW